jgi:hypothetical protein
MNGQGTPKDEVIIEEQYAICSLTLLIIILCFCKYEGGGIEEMAMGISR